MPQGHVGQALRKRKPGVERVGPCPKKQSGAPPPPAPSTPEEEQQLVEQIVAKLEALSDDPVNVPKHLSELSPADEVLAGLHAALLTRGRKDLADRLLVWWIIEEEQAEWDSQKMMHQYLDSLSSSERVEDQAKFHLIAHNHLALYQDLESRGRWKAIATSKEDFTNLRKLVGRVKHTWSTADDVFPYLKDLKRMAEDFIPYAMNVMNQKGDNPEKEGINDEFPYMQQMLDIELIERNAPAFYVLIEEACGDGLWDGKLIHNGEEFQLQWTLGRDTWGPHYGVCRHMGWDFSKHCGCGVPYSIRMSGEQSSRPWTPYRTCHMNSRGKEDANDNNFRAGCDHSWGGWYDAPVAAQVANQSNELHRLLLKRYIERLPEEIESINTKKQAEEDNLQTKAMRLESEKVEVEKKQQDLSLLPKDERASAKRKNFSACLQLLSLKSEFEREETKSHTMQRKWQGRIGVLTCRLERAQALLETKGE